MERGRGCSRLPFACASSEPAAASVSVATAPTSTSERQREIRAPICRPPVGRESCRRSKPQIRCAGCNWNATLGGKIGAGGELLALVSAKGGTQALALDSRLRGNERSLLLTPFVPACESGDPGFGARM